ncbi:MAG: hypothetical protein JO153_09550 [Solirubrobacterales bacterium]|nr:hypothetical protein [Solirubrobacterales bacterium]MBV9916734.1 hypothetical protein [Solirubrobacterales bacterium]
MAVLRPVLIILALVVCGWFALGARQAHDTNAATTLLSQPKSLTPSQMKHVSDLLDSAGTLNPDRQVTILRGELATAQGQLGPARQILTGVLVSEPKNVDAWVAFGHASRNDRKAFLESVNRVSELVAHLH